MRYFLLILILLVAGCKAGKISKQKKRILPKGQEEELNVPSDGDGYYDDENRDDQRMNGKGNNRFMWRKDRRDDREYKEAEEVPVIVEASKIILLEEDMAVPPSPRPIVAKSLKVIDKVPVVMDSIKGIIAYSVPDTMTVAVSYSVKIRISKEKDKATLIVGDNNIPINDTTVHSTITIEQIRVEPIMSASLLSNDGSFEITPLSTETQNIEEHGYTEWQWNVKPLKSGDNQLKLIVKVRILNDQGGFFKDIVVFEKLIKTKANIKHSTKGFFEKYWQWLTTTMVLPFIIWLYQRRKKDKRKMKSSNLEV